MARFSDEVEAELRRAGWTPGRHATHIIETCSREMPQFEITPAARAALLEFGGLRFDISGPGVDKAKEPFDLLPLGAAGEKERFGLFSATVGKLFPLGELGHGAFFLAISDSGAVYVLGDDLQLAGGSMAEALDVLIRGLKLVWIDIPD